MRMISVLFATALIVSCGGGDGSDGSPTSPPAAPFTRTVSGTTRATGASSCTGDSHPFQGAAGTVSVTLNQSSGNTALMVQVCAGGVDNGNCTINQQKIEVGGTVTGTRIGDANQVLAFLPLNCGGGGPMPTAPITYSATVTYPQ